jgi:hypothetical protein
MMLWQMSEPVLEFTNISTNKNNNNMAITKNSITRGVVSRPPRIVLLGIEKIGKSSWAAEADSPIFIPVKLEEGIDALDVPKMPVCASFEALMEALQYLCEEEHDFKTVVIDSASALEPVIHQHVCDESNVKSIELAAGGYGKGYGEALTKWHDVMAALDYLRDEKGMASIIIGHVKTKRFDDPERQSYDRYIFDIHEKVASALYRWADMIGFASKSVEVVNEAVGFKKSVAKGIDNNDGEHILCTKNTPAHPGGGRGVYGRLPSEIPLHWSDFKEAIAETLADEAKAKLPKKKK